MGDSIAHSEDATHGCRRRPAWLLGLFWTAALAFPCGAQATGRFVALTGSDGAAGTIGAPWRTVEVAISRLVAGDTLYIRAGQYFEAVDATATGTPSSPIVIRSYPGEQVTLDSGFPEFQTPGNTAWQLISAPAGEYRSTATYGLGPVHGYVVPNGTYENGRMVLVPYDTTTHFHATTDQYVNPTTPFYVGPGTLVQPDGRISIRLAKTSDFIETEARYGTILNANADPRAYSIVLSQASSTLFVTGAYLTFLDLTINPAQRTVELAANTHHIRFENVTIWMGSSALEATSPGIHHVTVYRCRLYGDAPPWIFYSDMKDLPAPADLLRGTSLRLGDGTHDWEISYCHIRGSGQDLIGANTAEYNLAIHHNRLENALDDLIELEGALGRTTIYENLMLNGLTALAPGQSSPSFAGPLLVYRNVIGMLRNPPVSRLHGMNSWNGNGRHGFEYVFKLAGSGFGTRNTHLYHNTILLLNSVEGMNLTPQHPESCYVANNLLVTVNGVVNGLYRTGAGQLVNGNLYWKMNTIDTVPLTWNYDTVPALFAATGLEAQGLGATPKRGTNPQFTSLPLQVINSGLVDWRLTAASERIAPSSVFLGSASPARGAGLVIPAHPTIGTLPDSRSSLDLGAIPYGTSAAEFDVFPFNSGVPGPASPPSVLELQVQAGTDDAEEAPGGAVDPANSDLELVNDAGLQTVGVRFPGVPIPPGAAITRAYLQFQADELQSEATSLVIRAQAADQAPPFTSAAFNLSSRPLGAGSVAWSPVPWPVVGARELNERTPNLTALVQEVVNRPGWAGGNAIAFLITGTGHRTAESYEGDPAGAPLLHVEYVGNAVNQAPAVSAGTDQTISLPMLAQLLGVVNDDGLPKPPALSLAWTTLSGPAVVALSNPDAASTLAGFSTPGTYTFSLTVSDGPLAVSDSVTIVVQPEGTPALFERRVSFGGADAEENTLGSVDLTSSDLELVFEVDLQVVGLRFTNLPIPPSATLQNAWVQFKADEVQSEATNLTIRAQASDDAPAFVQASTGLTSRALTTAQASWSPPAWLTVGATGLGQRTPSLAAVIQEVVNRPGWRSGNALALLVSGTGHRTAESYEGDPAGAPLLHIQFVPGSPTVEVPGGAVVANRLGGIVTPSPSRGGATLRFATTKPGPAHCELFDLSGRRLERLGSKGSLPVGDHTFAIAGRDARGARLAAGVYFYRLVTADGAWPGRFVLMD